MRWLSGWSAGGVFRVGNEGTGEGDGLPPRRTPLTYSSSGSLSVLATLSVGVWYTVSPRLSTSGILCPRCPSSTLLISSALSCSACLLSRSCWLSSSATSMMDLGGSLLLLEISSLLWPHCNGSSVVGSLLCSGGVGDRVVIRTGSSQCMTEGNSAVAP